MKKRPAAGEVTLDEYINGLRDSRRQTDDAVALLGPAHRHASQTLDITWEMLFDLITQMKIQYEAEKKKKKKKGGKNPERPLLEGINKIVCVIYKLLQSDDRHKGLEHKTIEFEEKLAERRARIRREMDALAKEPGVSPELLQALERQLNLFA